MSKRKYKNSKTNLKKTFQLKLFKDSLKKALEKNNEILLNKKD